MTTADPKVFQIITAPSPAMREQFDFPAGRAQVNAIVAAPSRAAAVRAFCAAGMKVTDAEAKTYGSWTSHAGNVELATSRPGTVFAKPTGPQHTYQPFETEQA